MTPLIVGGIYFDKEYKMFFQVICITPEGVLTTCPSKFYLDATLKTTEFIRNNIKDEQSSTRIQAYSSLRKLNNKKLLWFTEVKKLQDNALMIIPQKDYTKFEVYSTPVSGDKATILSGSRVNPIIKHYNAERISPTAYMMNQPYHKGLEDFIINKSMDIKDYVILIHRQT